MVDDQVNTLRRQEPDWQVVTLSQVAILHGGYQQATILQKSKFDRARQAMEQYLAQHPGDAYTCAKLGALHGEAGNWATGLELLHQGLNQPELEPDICYELHYHLGLASRHLHQTTEAMDHYERAIAQDILPFLKLGAYNNLANLYQAQGDLDQAQALYQQTLTIDPNFATGYYNLGMVKKARGDVYGAMASYQTALRHNPNHAQTYQNLGVILLKLGQVQASLQAFGQAIQLHQQQGNGAEAQRLRQTLAELGF
jgi:tetratricopeptide (TPR) repeat protein